MRIKTVFVLYKNRIQNGIVLLRIKIRINLYVNSNSIQFKIFIFIIIDDMKCIYM